MIKRPVGFLDKLEQSSACSINKNFTNTDRSQFTREIHENELTPTGLNSAYFDFLLFFFPFFHPKSGSNILQSSY